MRFVTRAQAVELAPMPTKNSMPDSARKAPRRKRTALARGSRSAPELPGSIPAELIRHICLATVAVVVIYELPLVRYPIGLVLLTVSGWIAIRTLGALRSPVAAVGVSLGLLAILIATQFAMLPSHSALAETCRWSVRLNIGMLVALILADGLDLAQFRLSFGHWRKDARRPTQNLDSPSEAR